MKIKLSVAIFFILFLLGCEIKPQDKTLDSAKQAESNEKIVQEKQNEVDLKVEEQVAETIPEVVENIELNKGDKIPPFEFTEGIYVSAYTAASSRFPALLDSAAAAGINTIVFDLKNMNGHVFFSVPQTDALKRDRYKTIIDIPEVVKTLHERNMRAVSRIVVFHDQFLAARDSTLRIQKNDGTVWQENYRRKPSWLDSSNPTVQANVLYLIEQAARGGVDEVQLDYVRFPTGGKLQQASFNFQREDMAIAARDSNYVKRTKPDIITDFVSRAQAICDQYQTTLAADIFAIVAWQHPTDVSNTGQDIARITQHLDMIHPMIYSSHFADNFGFRQDVPNEPYYIMFKGTKLTKNYSAEGCRVVPYIQANGWKVNYSAEYVNAQIEAIRQAGGAGYILWNASSRYNKTLGWIRAAK